MYVLALVLILIDIVSKYFVSMYLKPIFSVNLPLKIIKLTYVENRGAAFGILQNQKLFFFLITILAIGFTVYYFFILPNNKVNNIIKLALVLIFSGTIGNFLDRIFRGYVVDFLEFTFINFPVFNFADIFLTVGCVLLFIFISVKK